MKLKLSNYLALFFWLCVIIFFIKMIVDDNNTQDTMNKVNDVLKQNQNQQI